MSIIDFESKKKEMQRKKDPDVISDILWDEEDDFPEDPDTYKEHISIFEKDLRKTKISEKTIQKHL